jgi:hypothetical protein
LSSFLSEFSNSYFHDGMSYSGIIKWMAYDNYTIAIFKLSKALIMNFYRLRPWLIHWIYFITFSHFVAGVLLAWFANYDMFDQYHQSILGAFWSGEVPAAARSLHIWWLSLFGATLQNLAIFMGVLTYIGNQQRKAFVWVWMIVGLTLWAPQDILISLQVNFWLHVWVDVAVLLLMLPPLICLWWNDRKR